MVAFALDKSSVQQSEPREIHEDIIEQLSERKNTLSRQDMIMMSLLKDHGLNIVEMKISPLSSAMGQLVVNFKIPPRSRILCVMRNDKPIIKWDLAFLKAGDSVFLLTEDDSLTHNLLIA